MWQLTLAMDRGVAVHAPATRSLSSICAPASTSCRLRPVAAPNDWSALVACCPALGERSATDRRATPLDGAHPPVLSPRILNFKFRRTLFLQSSRASRRCPLPPPPPMKSPDEDFEALRARYKSLRSSIANELRAIGSVPRPASRSESPTLPRVGEEQYYSLRESLIGNLASARGNQPHPSAESAIESHMLAQSSALHTSISMATYAPTHPSQQASAAMATMPRTAPTVSAATSNAYRPASGLEMSGTEPPAVVSSPAPVSVQSLDHGSVLVHAERPVCGPTPTLLTAHDIARTSASRHFLALRCHNGQSVTSSPRPKPSAALDPYQAHGIVFGHEALRAALASHRRHYLDSRDALRPTRKTKSTEAGHGGIVPAHPHSQPTPVIAAERADRRSSGTRAAVQQLTSTRTPNKASRAAACKSARPATRRVPIARPASAGATLRTVPMADRVHAASQEDRDYRQAHVLASMKQRSEEIHRNSVASPR